MRAVSLIAVTILFFSCQKDTCRLQPVQNVDQVNLQIDRKEKALFDTENGDQVKEFLNANPPISKGLLHSAEYPDINIISYKLFGLIQDPFIDTLYQESVAAFEKNEAQFTSEMQTALSWIKYYFPENKVPVIQTMVTGLYNDMFFADSVIVFGLDYFIGDSASYPPMNIPQYILKRYNYDYLAPTLIKFYITDKVTTGKENTLLSEMIDYGKIYYLLGRLFPCMDDWRLIGFTQEEMQLVRDNRSAIYANFNQNELWYDITQEMKRKFLGERPNVYEIHEKCPGRVGAWLGWEIVDSYMKKTGISMDQLLEERDHHKIFRESGYKAQ